LQSRFYGFNLWGQRKEIEKLKYMQRNRVVPWTGGEPGGLAMVGGEDSAERWLRVGRASANG
jgi:hypothetical protein